MSDIRSSSRTKGRLWLWMEQAQVRSKNIICWTVEVRIHSDRMRCDFLVPNIHMRFTHAWEKKLKHTSFSRTVQIACVQRLLRFHGYVTFDASIRNKKNAIWNAIWIYPYWIYPYWIYPYWIYPYWIYPYGIFHYGAARMTLLNAWFWFESSGYTKS